MLQIKIAQADEYDRVRDFYYSLIDAMRDAKYGPGWKKDIYPSRALLERSIEHGQLYIAWIDGQIAGCMIVNHEYNDGYKHITWSIEAADSELLVIHALGVHPMFSRRGIAGKMVREVFETARQNNIKAIRLDVLEGNIPAEKTYLKMGFKYLDTVQMFYEDTGWTNYRLFEYAVISSVP